MAEYRLGLQLHGHADDVSRRSPLPLPLPATLLPPTAPVSVCFRYKLVAIPSVSIRPASRSEAPALGPVGV